MNSSLRPRILMASCAVPLLACGARAVSPLTPPDGDSRYEISACTNPPTMVGCLAAGHSNPVGGCEVLVGQCPGNVNHLAHCNVNTGACDCWFNLPPRQTVPDRSPDCSCQLHAAPGDMACLAPRLGGANCCFDWTPR
jgi:hypothetical protein